MEPYKNLGGDSNIVAYQTGPDFIEVKFRDGSVYKYTNASVGTVSIETMKELAHNGQGLNSFINTRIRDNYESKR